MLIWKNKYGYELHEDKTENGVYGYVKHDRGFVAILAGGGGHVCLTQNFRYPLQKTILEIPKGYREKGETFLEAAKRELKEETGLIAKKWIKLGSFYPLVGFSNIKCHIFWATELSKKKMSLDEDEKLFTVMLNEKEVYNSSDIITLTALLLKLNYKKLKKTNKYDNIK